MADICNIGDERQLLTEDVTVVAVAGATTSGQFTLTTGRGNIQGISVIASNSANDFLTTINFQINSTNVLKNQNAAPYITINLTPQIFPVRWEQGSVISWNIVNTGASNTTIVFKLFYVLPMLV